MTAVTTDPWLTRAGQAMVASAVLHVLVPLFVGFGPAGMRMIVGGVICAGVAWLLLKGARWSAYLAFLIGLMGINAVLVMMAATPIPDTWLSLIFVADLAVAVFSFASIWRR